MTHFDVLIVGAGHAGSQVAISLRQLDFNGSIGIVGDEPDPPYERPPLSKDYLQQGKDFDRILIRPAEFWANQRITMILGRRVVTVDAEAQQIITEDGVTLSYDSLVWAAGGRPRRIGCAGHDFDGIHYVRTRADVDRLIAELPRAEDIVVVGGGYIGLESAAVLTKMNKRVVLLEALDRVLARVACAELSRFFEHEHREHGVDVRLGAHVQEICGSNRRVSHVRLHDGTTIPADCVIAGIGITPAVQPLAAAGAQCSNGVEVDAQCRTSLPQVFAIGDCALHKNRYAGGVSVRLESVQNAIDQAKAVAETLIGHDVRYASLPWFWSNQFDVKLQTAGLSLGYDRVEVHGNPADRRFTVQYYKDAQMIAVDCVNSPRDYVLARKNLSIFAAAA